MKENPFKSIAFNKLEKNVYAPIFVKAMPFFSAIIAFDNVAARIMMAAIESMDRFNECEVIITELDSYLDVSENTRKRALNVLRYMNFIETKRNTVKGGKTKFKISVQVACKGNVETKVNMEGAFDEYLCPSLLVDGQICKESFEKYKQFKGKTKHKDGLPF